MHDIVTSCSQLSALANWPNCSSQSTPYNGNHVDCVQNTRHGQLDGREQPHPQLHGRGWRALQQGVYWDNNTYFIVLLQNNVIDTDNFGMGCGGTCNTHLRQQLCVQGDRPARLSQLGNEELLQGSLQHDPDRHRRRGHAAGRRLRAGRQHHAVMPRNGKGCQLPVHVSGESQGAVWSNASYNLFTDPATAAASPQPATNTAQTTSPAMPTFVDSSRGWTCSLRAGSAGIARGGIGLGPRQDLDGRLRPLRYPTDVGAYVSESAAISFGGRLGELRLGMSRAAVTALYGNPRTIGAAPRRPGVRAVATYVRHGGNVWVTYGPGLTVVGLATNSRYFTTAAGLGPGAPLSVLERAPLHFHAVCDRHSYRRTGGGMAVDLRVLRGKITRVAINGARLAPSCK